MNFCAFEACKMPVHGHGLCGTHYRQKRRIGKLSIPHVPITSCKFTGCERPHKSKGYCAQHYQHSLKFGAPREIQPARWRGESKYVHCTVSGCAAKHSSHGWCMSHYGVWRRFGMNPNEYERMRAEQGYSCAICASKTTSGDRLHIDHDHATGAIRGLLCEACNLALGKFKDDPKILDRAAAYLRRQVAPPAAP